MRVQGQKYDDKRLVWPDGNSVNRLMEAARPAPKINAANDSGTGNAAYFQALLLDVAAKKDKEAFAELFDYFAPRIKSFLMKGGASPDVADELAQETMITVWQKAESFNPVKASASTWIFTIARNKRIDAIRKQGRPELDPADPLMVPDETPEAGEKIVQQQETEIMADAIQHLPPEQADLLYKSFFEDKTHADIAKETNLPLGTVKSRIRLALERLRSDKKVTELWS